ncbi:type II toxin-antitoxin system RelE/ParE family toxin [Pelagibaca abyssi]|nr:type II toxin-antitoxin system RelE/ParE family toxin [Salipiger abyssi]
MWRLTPQAQNSLIGIALWTLDRFGPAQAEIYENELLARCAEIARGRAHIRDCSALAGLPANRLYFARAGEHFAVFARRGNEVVFVDFLHAQSNLPTRLEALTLLD